MKFVKIKITFLLPKYSNKTSRELIQVQYFCKSVIVIEFQKKLKTSWGLVRVKGFISNPYGILNKEA